MKTWEYLLRYLTKEKQIALLASGYMNSVDYEAFLRRFLERFLPEQSKGIFPDMAYDMMLKNGWGVWLIAF